MTDDLTDDLMSPRHAERLARAARAAQTLSETLWEALHEELTDPHELRVAELAERLANVSATVALLARGKAGASSAAVGRHVAPAEPEQHVASVESEPVAHEQPVVPAQAESPAARAVYDESSLVSESPTAQEPPSVAVLVDELAPESLPEIEIRDERRERDPSVWTASIGRGLERHQRDGLGFAVLLVELVDVERLRHAELPGEVARLTGLVETVLANELRPADSLTRESPGRYWLLAQETDSDSARALAGRLAEVVRGAASHRGTPLEIAVGIAMCPANGSRAAELAAHADIALYAARASGRSVAPVDDPA